MGRQAGIGLFLRVFVQKPSLKLGSATEWPSVSHAKGTASFLVWMPPGTLQACGYSGRWRNISLQVVLAFSAKCPQLRELVLSTSLCPLLGSCAPGCVRGQRTHLLPESTGDVPGRVGGFCYETQAGDGGSVTQSSRDTFHMVHPTLLLPPTLSLDRLGLQWDSPV